MELVITEWALSSYLGLLTKRVFTKEGFQNIRFIRLVGTKYA